MSASPEPPSDANIEVKYTSGGNKLLGGRIHNPEIGHADAFSLNIAHDDEDSVDETRVSNIEESDMNACDPLPISDKNPAMVNCAVSPDLLPPPPLTLDSGGLGESKEADDSTAEEQMKKWIGDQSAAKQLSSNGNHGYRSSSTPTIDGVESPASTSMSPAKDAMRGRPNDFTKAPPKISPWLKCLTEEEGWTFYYNTVTGESSWENPECSTATRPEPSKEDDEVSDSDHPGGEDSAPVQFITAASQDDLGEPASPSSRPSSIAPSPVIVNNQSDVFLSAAADENAYDFFSLSTVSTEASGDNKNQSRELPPISDSVAVIEDIAKSVDNELSSVDNPPWLDDAKSLMKLLQQDSPLPQPSEKEISSSDTLPPPPEVAHSTPLNSGDTVELPVENNVETSANSGGEATTGDVSVDPVTPCRDTGDNDSVISIRSGSSRSLHKSLSGSMQMSPAVCAGGTKNSSGQSVLHITAATCNFKALTLLLAGGLDPDVTDGRGRTALMQLCMLPDPSSAGSESKNGSIASSSADRLACLDALLRHGADLSVTDKEGGNTALHLCVLSGTRWSGDNDTVSCDLNGALAVSCLGLLIDNGADISVANSEGDSPLHLAAKLGQLEMMQVIMDRSNAHHLLHPSPVPHHMAAIPVGSKSLLHNNQGTTTPASAAVDASFGTSTFGNLTGYSTDTSEYVPSTVNGTVQPKGHNSSSGGPFNLEKHNQHPSSEVSVQSLSYSPVSTDLGKHYISDLQVAVDTTRAPISATKSADNALFQTITDEDIRPEFSAQVDPVPVIEADRVTSQPSVTVAKSSDPPESRKPFVDDSVPMHQTLWDKLASSSDNPELSPWGDSVTPPPRKELTCENAPPTAQKLSYDANLEADGHQEGHFSNDNEDADAEVDMSYEQYQEPSAWQPYLSDEGYTYYYNSVTGETRWELPSGDTYGEAEVTEQDDSYYVQEGGEEIGYGDVQGQYNYDVTGLYDESGFVEEVPVWKQGGGMRTVVIDTNGESAQATTPSAWNKPAASQAPYSNVRDTNVKISLAPHSPMVYPSERQDTDTSFDRGGRHLHVQSTAKGMIDYVHTPVKMDDRAAGSSYGYSISDMANKHLFREGRRDLMSPPMQVMRSEDSLENTLYSPHMTKPPRISASPIPMSNVYTPSKVTTTSNISYSPLVGSPNAGFFSPTAPTPRQHDQAFSEPVSPYANHVSSPDMSERDMARPLEYDFVAAAGPVASALVEQFEEEVAPPLSRNASNSSMHSPNVDSQDGNIRHNRAPSVSSLSDDQSDGSTITVRHLEVWNKFFENAIKSGESKKMANKRKYLLEQYQAPKNKSNSDKNLSSSIRRSVQPAGLKPRYDPVESRSKSNRVGNKSAGELWPEELSEDIYDELITDATMLLSRNVDSADVDEATEEYVLDDNGEYVPRERTGPSKDDFTMGSVALIAATAHGDIEAVEQLLVFGVYPSCVDSHIRTPLHHAAHRGSDEIVAMLNDFGGDVDARDATGQTPLHVACCYGHVNIVRALLESAATPDARNDTNGVPMHFAAAGGHIDCILLLREYGASVFAVDSYGTSVVDVAETISPRDSQVQRLISILRSLSETDSRQLDVETTRNERIAQVEDPLEPEVSKERVSRSKRHINENKVSNPSSPDSGRVSKRTLKAQEIKRLAERENKKASKPGAGKSDASSRGVRMLADAVEQAQNSVGHKKVSSRERPKHSRGLNIERDEYTYSDENNSSSSDSQGGYEGIYQKHLSSSQSSVASNSSSQKFLDPRKVRSQRGGGVNNRDEVSSSTVLSSVPYRGGSGGNHNNMPVKVANAPASPPRAFATGRAHSNSFTESETSGPKKPDQTPSRRYSQGTSEEEDEPSPEGGGISSSVSKVVGGMVWGVASSLFGATIGIISGSRSDANGNLDKIPEEESVDNWKVLAPPTDHELRQRGLGFCHPPSPLHRGVDGEIIVPQSPRPPDIVAAELDAKMVAYKKGLTPRRDVIVPPREVILAVDMARAAYEDSSRRPAPLDIPICPPIPESETGESGSVGEDSNNNSGYEPSVASNHSGASQVYKSQPKKGNVNNGYSMGASMPDGVRWRYVDVLNTDGSKKKSPSKSPKHRISTIAAMNSVKGGSNKHGSDASMMFSSSTSTVSGSSDKNRAPVHSQGYSSTRKASV